MWRIFYRSVDAVSLALGWVAGGLILCIALMIMAEILLRNLAGISLTFVWEISAYFHIAAIFLGLAFTLRTGGHIQVAILQRPLGRLFELVSTLGGLVISAYLSLALVRLCLNWASTGRTSGTVDNIPLAWPMTLVAVGACLLTLQLLLRLVHLLTGAPHELPWGAGPSAE
ncbi:TRAP transporter small permease [Roseovarius sp.]|uniref:TRAP transporter small permease protein n=1 Tax=Roseovarius nubinhibens TaxID=314263 RepID=A0A348W9I4_9RHOB|nr:TRAP transporter small permease [Roseovarius sp.]MAO28116.1 C4-dicarboxylate ABC transporter permease [Roseovarius sp.]MAZ20996.1 C4-dicarboxylate ABC transporter permease [Roseovarius sp.]HAR51196.1 TRAP transporter small permease [Roseovarius nubinhibens]|tara:strand:+ start:239 stop:751 length:513 start_codon:yes stop_codon:yes gene_type:complete